MKAETITGVNALPMEEGEVKKGKAEKKAGKRIGYNYIVVKSFKESQKNDVVKCLYIKSLTKWGFCVIKEGTFGDTKDKHGRDIIDRLKWQEKLHKKLQNELRIPKFLGSFEENGNYYLVIELIRGKALASMIRKHEKRLRDQLLFGGKTGQEFMGYLIQIVELLEKLHKNGIVHRDATGGNFMISKWKKVALIDLELSYSLGDQFPSPPFELGTFGYMSPQQESTQTPTIYEDTFSIGAIVMQVFTGMSPSKLTQLPGEALKQRVRFFIPDKILSDLVINVFNPEPGERPALSLIKEVLLQYKKDTAVKRPRSAAEAASFSQSAMLSIIQEGINTFATSMLADKEYGWFAENTKIPPNPEKHKINKAYYGSFYNGVAGIIYYLCQAKKNGMDISGSMENIAKGFELIENKYVRDSISSHPGLYFGSAGIALTLQESMLNGLLPFSMEEVDKVRIFLSRENNHLDYLNGIAGQGLAIIHSQSLFKATNITLPVDPLVVRLLDAQRPDGSWARGGGNTNKRIHLSFAYGISGIIYFLLTYYCQTPDLRVKNAVERGLQCLMSQAVHHLDALIWRKESKNHYGWWCAGEVGIAQTFIRAFDVLKDPAYKTFALGALHNYNASITDNNFSQCHGLSSLGEIYLEAFRVFEEEEWLSRASWIANLLLHCRKRHPQHGIWWQVEHERQPTGSFMMGNSGVQHFLLRYCFPGTISLPLEPTSDHQWPSGFGQETYTEALFKNIEI